MFGKNVIFCIIVSPLKHSDVVTLKFVFGTWQKCKTVSVGLLLVNSLHADMMALHSKVILTFIIQNKKPTIEPYNVVDIFHMSLVKAECSCRVKTVFIFFTIGWWLGFPSPPRFFNDSSEARASAVPRSHRDAQQPPLALLSQPHPPFLRLRLVRGQLCGTVSWCVRLACRAPAASATQKGSELPGFTSAPIGGKTAFANKGARIFLSSSILFVFVLTSLSICTTLVTLSLQPTSHLQLTCTDLLHPSYRCVCAHVCSVNGMIFAICCDLKCANAFCTRSICHFIN